MTRFLLAALFLFPLAALAQGTEVGDDVSDVRYRVTPALSDTLTTAAFDALPDKATFTGVVADRHPNGRLKLLRSVVDGRTAGLWTEWYPSGVVRYLGGWVPGDDGGPSVGEGPWYYFHENGVVRYREVYRADRAWGPSEGWHSNGRKAFEGTHRDGDRVGRWRWWSEAGTLDSTRTYSEVGWRPVRDGQVRPFAPGVVSTGDAQAFGLALSADGREAYVTRRAPGEQQAIYVTRFEDEAWSPLERAPFSTGTDESPHLSPDDTSLYFASRRAGANDGPDDASDNLWVVDRQGDGWGAPRPAGAVNVPRLAGQEWPVASALHPALGPDGALYYWTQTPSGTPDLYRSLPDGEGYAPGQPLPPPVNTSVSEASPAIGPGGVLVFQAYGRSGGTGREDLFASWPDGDGWTEPVPLPVNTPADDLLPSFSADGRTLFFASDRDADEYAYSVYYVDWSRLGVSAP